MTYNAEEVLAIEKRFWEEGTPELFEEHFAHDGIAIFEPMPIIDKATSIEMAKTARPFTNVQMEDVHIQDLTPDCITISYHGQGEREGEEDIYRGRLSSVYVLRDGKWQMALTVHQPWHRELES
jgi:hypothetical protein